jgi:hypothetical protein
MRSFTRLAGVLAAAGLFIVPAATSASAATAQPAGRATAAASVHLTGGTTRVKTAPGIAVALLKAGIVPVPAGRASESVVNRDGRVAVRFAFPVTGGHVSLSPLGGSIHHRGGIEFINIANGKTITVGRFHISLTDGDLTGIVNGNPKVRVPLFWVNLSHAHLNAGQTSVHATGIELNLTRTAASALDSALGTSLFSKGMEIGTAKTVLRF